MKRNLATRRKAEQRGRASEVWAAALLLAKLYRILGWRVRTPVGEIDLIARAPNGLVCFVEVKARGDVLGAAQSLGARQQRRIVHAASHYLATRPHLAAKGMRFDVIAVAPGKFPRHFPDAWRDDGGR
ncbi:MAG TPA: YraN family protein [Rhizomicrobium sp.]|nr:YraN family protein [Rhizomicrobium sp.]